MGRKRISFWDVLIWVGIVLIIGWAILKSVGVIESPVWVEMIPYFGAGASIMGGAYKLGKIMRGIESTNRKVDGLVKFGERFRKLEHEHGLCMDGKLNVGHSRLNRGFGGN